MTSTTLRLPLSPDLLALATTRVRGLPRFWRALAAALVVAPLAYQVSLALESPGQSLRRELVAAAAEAETLPWNRSHEQVRNAVGRHFADRAVNVDSHRFPAEVTVALQGIDRATCVEASRVAYRIEGSTVVTLEGIRSPADCRESNRMVWRIMP